MKTTTCPVCKLPVTVPTWVTGEPKVYHGEYAYAACAEARERLKNKKVKETCKC